MSKVVIVVPCFNHMDYLNEALSSIYSQKVNFDFEVHVHDDCSLDNTGEIVSTFQKKHNNLYYFRNKKNLGMLKNYKYAFSLVDSEYIAILEGDDYWSDVNKLASQVKLLDAHPNASMCFHNFVGLLNWNKKFVFRPDKHDPQSEEVTINDVYHIRSIGNFSVCVYRTEFVRKIPESYYDNKEAADFLFNLYMIKQGPALFLPGCLSVYRIHNKSQWSSLEPKEKLKQTLLFSLKYYQMFPECGVHDFLKIAEEASEDYLNESRELILANREITKKDVKKWLMKRSKLKLKTFFGRKV